MGEDKSEQTALVKAIQGAIAVQSQTSGDLRVSTPGGVFQVRWDDNASASALTTGVVAVWWSLKRHPA
jgi:hypothetical protein